MKFYVVMTLLVVAMVGGYKLSESYRQLDDFHRKYLEGGPRVPAHVDSADHERSG